MAGNGTVAPIANWRARAAAQALSQNVARQHTVPETMMRGVIQMVQSRSPRGLF
jgi:hypothetical protein